MVRLACGVGKAGLPSVELLGGANGDDDFLALGGADDNLVFARVGGDSRADEDLLEKDEIDVFVGAVEDSESVVDETQISTLR